MNDPQRWRDARVRVSLSGEHVRGQIKDRVEIVEASNRGLRLHAARPLPVNELLKLVISLPQRDLAVHTVAVRAFRIGHIFGVGCRFFALNGGDKDEWERFVSLQRMPLARAA